MENKIDKEVSIIIPVYNEAGNIAKLHQEIILALSQGRFRYEIIFVNDGSTDNTAQILKQLIASSDHTVYIQHARNFGQSAALISGAKMARYPYLITLDGDGQNDPRDIPALLAHIQHKKQVILGIRKKRQDHLIKKISSSIGNYVRQLLLQDNCTDTGCSLKCFSCEVFLSLPHFNHLHRFLPALFKRAGCEIINLPVNHRPRLYGQSKYGLFDRLFVGIYDLIGVRWLLKRPCMPEVIDES